MGLTNVSETSTFNGIALGPNADGVFVIGGTKDVLYGGDVSNDTAGDGIALVAADGDQHFALMINADDGGTALTAGWVSTIFGGFKNHTAITGGPNVSVHGVTGQVHMGASINSTGNFCGVYGIAETVSGVTITNTNFFGGNFGATIPSGATLAAGAWAGGIVVSGNYGGTTTGKVVGMHFMNPSGAYFDGAFSFGQNSAYAGCVATGAVGGSQTHKLKVFMGGTAMYIPMNTS